LRRQTVGQGPQTPNHQSASGGPPETAHHRNTLASNRNTSQSVFQTVHNQQSKHVIPNADGTMFAYDAAGLKMDSAFWWDGARFSVMQT